MTAFATFCPAEPGMLAAVELLHGCWCPGIVEQVGNAGVVTALRFANGHTLRDPGFVYVDGRRLVADPEALLLKLRARYRSLDELRKAALPTWQKYVLVERPWESVQDGPQAAR